MKSILFFKLFKAKYSNISSHSIKSYSSLSLSFSLSLSLSLYLSIYLSLSNISS